MALEIAIKSLQLPEEPRGWRGKLVEVVSQMREEAPGIPQMDHTPSKCLYSDPVIPFLKTPIPNILNTEKALHPELILTLSGREMAQHVTVMC